MDRPLSHLWLSQRYKACGIYERSELLFFSTTPARPLPELDAISAKNV